MWSDVKDDTVVSFRGNVVQDDILFSKRDQIQASNTGNEKQSKNILVKSKWWSKL